MDRYLIRKEDLKFNKIFYPLKRHSWVKEFSERMKSEVNDLSSRYLENEKEKRMKYKYIGGDCAFANTGDIFEPSASGKGYLHFYDEERKAYTCLPNDKVEDSEEFSPIDHEEILKNLIVCLEDLIMDGKVDKEEKKGLRYMLNWIEERL